MPLQIARAAVAVVAGLGLLACKTPYHKEGASTKDFERDKYACFAEARAGSWAYGFPRDEGLYAKCMESRGWSRTAKGAASEGSDASQAEPASEAPSADQSQSP